MAIMFDLDLRRKKKNTTKYNTKPGIQEKRNTYKKGGKKIRKQGQGWKHFLNTITNLN